jgi:adenosylcobinamide-GDP ribazoletransferase
VRGTRLEHHIAALLLALGSTLLFGGLRGMCIGVLVGLATLGMQSYFYQRLGGITGDVLGATNELNEALVLLLATVVY